MPLLSMATDEELATQMEEAMCRSLLDRSPTPSSPLHDHNVQIRRRHLKEEALSTPRNRGVHIGRHGKEEPSSCHVTSRAANGDARSSPSSSKPPLCLHYYLMTHAPSTPPCPSQKLRGRRAVGSNAMRCTGRHSQRAKWCQPGCSRSLGPLIGPRPSSSGSTTSSSKWGWQSLSVPSSSKPPTPLKTSSAR